MKKKKGFTLIELLAVIVILAVLAIIVTPMIADVIASSKKASAEQSALNYVSAVNNAVMTCMIKEDGYYDDRYDVSNIADECLASSIEVKGTNPTGSIIISDGVVVAYNLKIDGYEIIKDLPISEKIYWAVTDTNNDSVVDHLEISSNEITGVDGGSFSGYDSFGYENLPWNKYTYARGIKTEDVLLSASITGNVVPTSLWYWFYEATHLKTIDFTGLDTSYVSISEYMFAGDESLESLDINSWNTSRLSSVSYMFSGCSKLTELNISSWDTSNFGYTEAMFRGCSGLTTLDLSNFNTSNVTGMNEMFNGCSELTSLDLSSFDTSKVKKMSYMLSNCSKLKELNLSNFDMTLVTEYENMLSNDTALTTLITPKIGKTSVALPTTMYLNGTSTAYTTLPATSMNLKIAIND